MRDPATGAEETKTLNVRASARQFGPGGICEQSHCNLNPALLQRDFRQALVPDDSISIVDVSNDNLYSATELLYVALWDDVGVA